MVGESSGGVQGEWEVQALHNPMWHVLFCMDALWVKSVGSTFARVVQIGFECQLHKNIDAYMYDIVVKIKDKASLTKDLKETFANL